MGFEEHGAECGRQRQRVDGRNHHRDRNGNRELAEKLTGNARNERHRDEHRQQHQRNGDNRCRDLAHGKPRGLRRRDARVFLQLGLDRLDHDDRIIDDDADSQHERQQRDSVG